MQGLAVASCGTGTHEKMLRLNEMLTEKLGEVIDQKDEYETEIVQLKQELADLRAQGLAFLKETLAAKVESAAEIAKLRAQLADAERLVGFFKAAENFHIEQDLILDSDTGQRIGAQWKAQGLVDPRELWNLD